MKDLAFSVSYVVANGIHIDFVPSCSIFQKRRLPVDGEFGSKHQSVSFQGLDSILGYAQIKANSWRWRMVGIQRLKGDELER